MGNAFLRTRQRQRTFLREKHFVERNGNFVLKKQKKKKKKKQKNKKTKKQKNKKTEKQKNKKTKKQKKRENRKKKSLDIKLINEEKNK